MLPLILKAAVGVFRLVSFMRSLAGNTEAVLVVIHSNTHTHQAYSLLKDYILDMSISLCLGFQDDGGAERERATTHAHTVQSTRRLIDKRHH